MSAEIVFVGSREARVIPQGWQHPRDDRGRYIPLFRAGYWREETDPECGYTADDCIPQTDGPTEIAAYEYVTEGTPISRAFPNTPEGKLALVRYCAGHATTFGDHKADAEAWAAILFGDAAIASDGTVVAQDH